LVARDTTAVSCTRSEEDLEQAVLAYLTEHPRAMDSLVGIAEWWLEFTRVRTEIEALSRALDRLVQRSVLERIGSGERALYRLASRSRDSTKGDET
jgi:hypothetical protein